MYEEPFIWETQPAQREIVIRIKLREYRSSVHKPLQKCTQLNGRMHATICIFSCALLSYHVCGGEGGGGDNWQYCHVCMKSQTCYHQMLWLYSMQIQHIHPMHAICNHTLRMDRDLLGGVGLKNSLATCTQQASTLTPTQPPPPKSNQMSLTMSW